MRSKLVLQVRETDDLSYLNRFGPIIFKDDIIDIVIIETEKSNMDELKKLPCVLDVKESRKGMLLET